MNLDVLNPWWKGKEFIKEDPHIKKYLEKKFKWEPGILREISLRPNNVFTLRGPRQVGKSTLVKLLIQGLLEKTPEKAVFYWNCDECVDYASFVEVIREYLDFAKQYDLGDNYIFLDEVSGLEDWQKGIKLLVDSGELENCCVFLTGSHTLDIKYGIERLPGRRGKLGKDIMLLPMSFREFVGLVEPELLKEVQRVDPFSISGIQKAVKRIKHLESKLKVLFSQYMLTGGFPLTVNEFFENRMIPDYVYELYFSWVVGDLVKWGKQERILVQVMGAAIAKQGSVLSWDSFAKEAEVKSHKTISSYVEDLENMFVLIVLYYMDLYKRAPDYAKNKKVLFFDPFIYHVFNRKLNFKEGEITPALMEAVVASHLNRSSYEDDACSTFYWKNKKDVDVVLKRRDEVCAFEVKYQGQISKSDWAGLYYFKKGVLVTKNHFEVRKNFVAVPVHLFLTLL